jgi:hypothetical protein
MMPWECFVCRSQAAECGHREMELVSWWAEQRTDPPDVVLPVMAAKRKPKVKPIIVARPVPIEKPMAVAISATGAAPIRGTRIVGEYSGLRGW